MRGIAEVGLLPVRADWPVRIPHGPIEALAIGTKLEARLAIGTARLVAFIARTGTVYMVVLSLQRTSVQPDQPV